MPLVEIMVGDHVIYKTIRFGIAHGVVKDVLPNGQLKIRPLDPDNADRRIKRKLSQVALAIT